MRGRVSCPNGLFAFNIHADLHALQRLGGELFGIERVDVPYQSVIGGQGLGILQFDAAFIARLDGKDTGLQRAAAGVLQQSRVAHLPDDFFIGLARLGGIQHLTLNWFTVDPQGKAAHSGILREREHVSALNRPFIGVVKDLIHMCGGNLIRDGDRHVVIANLQLLHGRNDRIRGNGRVGDDNPIGLHRADQHKSREKTHQKR